MTIQAIQDKMDQCLSDMKTEGIHNLPQLIKDLDYLMNHRLDEEKQLTLGQQLSCGADFYEQTQTYYLELLKQYLKEFLQVEIKVEEDPNIALIGIAGYSPEEDAIKVSPTSLLLGGRNKTSSMQSIFHETRHKIQRDAYKKDNIDEVLDYPENMILLAKEFAFLGGQDDDCYKTNYPLLYTETDADEFGFMCVRSLLGNLLIHYKEEGNTLSTEDEISLRKLQKQMIEDSSKDEQRFFDTGRYSTKIRREAMGLNPPSGEFEIAGEKIDRLIAVDQYIKTHPEVTLEFPILKLIEGKDYDEIIRDRTAAMEKEPEKAVKLYQCVIQSDPMLYLEDCINEGRDYQLNQFLEKHPTLLISYPEELKKLAEKTNYPLLKQLIATQTTL